MPDGTIVPYSEKKMEFLKLCKFTISCESISYPGFVTEKLANPLCYGSVPIYYGNPLVSKEFNPEAMINLHEYPSFEERVIEADRNDELYIRMLMAPRFVSENYMNCMYLGLKDFLFSIFSQGPEEAYRRLRFYIQQEHENRLDEYRRFSASPEYKLFNMLHPKKQRETH